MAGIASSWLQQIMFRVRDAVKFGASHVCPMCNSGCKGPLGLAGANTGPPAVAAFMAVQRGYEMTSAFQEHEEELEHYERMFGRERGRLAVSLDRLTNALVLVGQHGVYCTSQRNPAVPAMDLRMINQELVHAKELVQSVMEEMRLAKQKSQS
jgi:hypothetical protein